MGFATNTNPAIVPLLVFQAIRKYLGGIFQVPGIFDSWGYSLQCVSPYFPPGSRSGSGTKTLIFRLDVYYSLNYPHETSGSLYSKKLYALHSYAVKLKKLTFQLLVYFAWT